jgi:hypothetical protein
VKLILILFLFCFCIPSAWCQNSLSKIDSAFANKISELWIHNLIEPGVTVDKDSMVVNPEVRKLLLDSSYRKQVYPESYTWPFAVDLLNKMELKKAFWSFINLYSNDSVSRKLILESILTYDQAIDMEKALIASYYTYSFADPQVGTVINQKLQVTNPNLMEKKFNQMKEIVSYVRYSRSEQSKLKEGIQKNQALK